MAICDKDLTSCEHCREKDEEIQRLTALVAYWRSYVSKEKGNAENPRTHPRSGERE